MKTSALFSLVFTLCLILLSHSPLAANAKSEKSHGSDLVGKICKETMQDNARCLELLNEEPRTHEAKNYLELSKVILEFALKKGIEGQNFLKGLGTASRAISECANFHYNGVVGSFRSSLNEISDDPQTANYDAKVAGDGPDACARGLASEKIVNPDINALNSKISLLSNIAFWATDKLS
ncbi:uncharacterized protein LOC113871788 [Abrus precatorius]|uniref:Uncharacterized protein LOC113871788 n=1 Tax=Abrus precatorius TaxID=3816 RepID=A0A8B8M7P1_ABRPR|nr:uncharacterized protein LOC113871788 [Abrus precatorius]